MVEEEELEDEKRDMWQMWNQLREDGKKIVSSCMYVCMYVCMYILYTSTVMVMCIQ